MRKTALALILIVVAAGCSTNPATGKREFNIVSEQQEIAMGQQSHQEVIREFGLYREKPELSRMVEEIGRRIAADSDRPKLPWTFTILDSPIVNAMALPGGYIYITRGMLERVNSEDELASVLGHEIAHVTARHAAQQISRAQLAQFGMVLGAVVAGPQAAQTYGQLAEIGMSLLFQRYSRAQESQADTIGTRYMAKSRYNPIGAELMLMALMRLNKNPAQGIERYFQSHPDPAKRVGDVRKVIAEFRQAGVVSQTQPDRTSYVRRLDGITTANATDRVIIKDNTIYDRSHGMIIPVPSAAWRGVITPGALFAIEPRSTRSQSYLVAQEVPNNQLQGYNVQDAVRNNFARMGLQHLGSRQASTRSGQSFPIDVWGGQTQSGPVGVETTQMPHGDHVAVFIFVAPNLSRSNSPLGSVLGQATIDPARTRSIQPPRMRTGAVRAGDTWASIARRATGSERDAEEVANLNGFDLRDRPTPNMLVKLPEEVIRED